MANTNQPLVFFDLVRALPFGDKLGHIGLFGLLTLAANMASQFRMVTIFRVKIFLGTVIVIVLVTLEEFSQLFVANRTFDITDLLADAVGILLFTFVSLKLSQKLCVNRRD